ncbi:uncharacterized protein B0T23DRAFT_33327 [Neurospora hispaniola]|uniref:Uncharacterized protein n=1 Tax=Neurospora hispaniola TaxID=588809 RepID=A0AAJ0IGM8_9PEZI|nr:hypothetical protein B0T23DRAFT_33327 [Neurospora hispaniola]
MDHNEATTWIRRKPSDLMANQACQAHFSGLVFPQALTARWLRSWPSRRTLQDLLFHLVTSEFRPPSIALPLQSSIFYYMMYLLDIDMVVSKQDQHVSAISLIDPRKK